MKITIQKMRRPISIDNRKTRKAAWEDVRRIKRLRPRQEWVVIEKPSGWYIAMPKPQHTGIF